jgi:predicted RNase H-like HicB family nuclease
LVVKKLRRIAVKVERDEAGWWVASALGVAGVHTQGRTLAQVRERIREALEAATGVEAVEIDEQLELEKGLQRRLAEAVVAREDADRLQRRAQDTARAAVASFSQRGMSTRDVGDLLRLSHQRVHQLLRAGGSARSSAAHKGGRKREGG